MKSESYWSRLRQRLAKQPVLALLATMKSESFWSRLRQRLAEQPVLVLFAITFFVAAILKPVKVGLMLWGIAKLASFAFAGKWVYDNLADDEPNPTTDEREQSAFRRAIVVAASIVAGALLP